MLYYNYFKLYRYVVSNYFSEYYCQYIKKKKLSEKLTLLIEENKHVVNVSYTLIHHITILFSVVYI